RRAGIRVDVGPHLDLDRDVEAVVVVGVEPDEAAGGQHAGDARRIRVDEVGCLRRPAQVGAVVGLAEAAEVVQQPLPAGRQRHIVAVRVDGEVMRPGIQHELPLAGVEIGRARYRDPEAALLLLTGLEPGPVEHHLVAPGRRRRGPAGTYSSGGRQGTWGTIPVCAAPAVIQASTKASSAGVSDVPTYGIRAPSPVASVPCSFCERKLAAAFPGATLSLPARAATGLTAGTPTRLP